MFRMDCLFNTECTKCGFVRCFACPDQLIDKRSEHVVVDQLRDGDKHSGFFGDIKQGPGLCYFILEP